MPIVNIIEPADQTSEHYQQLIRQNLNFVVRLTAAIESGAESAAAVTATVRTNPAYSALGLDSGRRASAARGAA
jgi:hypothetical protein